MPWTSFMDMHSGGGAKEKWRYIYIEAPQDEAECVFYNRFGHNPNRVSCTCCGNDYSIDENDSLARATAFQRNCAWEGDGYVEKPRTSSYWTYDLISIEDYLRRPEILVIRADEINPDERKGELPR